MRFGEYLYNNLPAIYRIRDTEVNYTLKKYLNALGEGFDLVNDETLNILTLIDPERIDSKFLPFFASMFGVSFDFDVPEEFLRKYLANLVDILKRKGTKEVIEFTARELTGLNATVREGHNSMFRTWSDNPHDEKCGDYSVPHTYASNDKPIYYYLGGDRTDRFTVHVTLGNPTDKGSDEIFLNTQMLAQLVRNLVQPYISLIFKAYGILDSEVVNKLDVQEEEYVLRVNNRYIKKSKVVDTLSVNKLYMKDYYQVTSQVTDEFIDTIKLLNVETDNVSHRTVSSLHTKEKVVTKESYLVASNVTHETMYKITETPHVYEKPVRVIEHDLYVLKDENTKDPHNITYEDLGVTKNRTVNSEEVYVRKTYTHEDNILSTPLK